MGFAYVVRPTGGVATVTTLDLLKDKSWRQAQADRVISSMLLTSDSGGDTLTDQTAQLLVGSDIVAEWDYLDEAASGAWNSASNYRQVSIKVPANAQLSLVYSNKSANTRTPTFGVVFTT